PEIEIAGEQQRHVAGIRLHGGAAQLGQEFKYPRLDHCALIPPEGRSLVSESSSRFYNQRQRVTGDLMMRALALLCLLLLPGLARAAEPTITITVAGDTRSFTRSELLARPDVATIEVARDVTYRVPMTYRAVPVASLLAGMTLPPDSVLEAVTLDGF